MLLKLDEGRVININYIIKIWENDSGNYDIVLINGEVVKITASQYKNFEYVVDVRDLQNNKCYGL